jgi:hypothetical protein
MGLASINIKFQVDLREFSTEMQNSLRTIDKFGQKMQSVGRGLTAAITLPILAVGAASVKMASDYNESLNKVDVAFKGSSAQVKEFAKTSLESFGLAEGSALDAASSFGDMATSMGLPDAAAAKMSTSLVGLAADLASFKNISIDQANTALAAVFTGETESLKKLGIVLTEANLQQFAYSQGIKIRIQDLSQAEKVQLRYNYILSVTKNAQGDFARTSGGAANQTRIFTESLKQVGQQIGAVILPLFTRIITSINEQIKSFSKLSEGTKTTIVVVAALAAVVGPLVFAIGAVAAVIPTVVAGFTILSGAVTAVSGAFTALSAAMIANPITALILLVSAAAAAYFLLDDGISKVAKSTVELSNAQKLSGQITNDATNAIIAQKAELQSLLDIANNETKSKKERLKAIQDINAISPKYLGNLTLENIGTDKARIAIEKYNVALLQGAKAKAAQEVLQELYKKEIETSIKREKAEASKNKLLDESNKKQFTSAQEQQRYNDLLNDKSGILKTLRQQEDSDLKSQIAVANKVYNQGKDYLDLLKEIGGESIGSNVKGDKVKAPADIQALQSNLTPGISKGSIEAYDAQIAKLKEFRDQVATTAEQIKLADEKIKAVEFAKALNFDPSSLIKSVETTEVMMGRLAASVSGAKAVLEVEQNSMAANALDFNARFNEVWLNTVENFAVGFGELIGQFAQGGLSLANVGSLFLTTLADMAIQVGKIAIQVGVAVFGIKKALESLNPFVAIAAGVALIAVGTIAKSALSNAAGGGGGVPKFANGGIVSGTSFYGDKILARVNSGEMIANSDQQKRIYNAMGGSGAAMTIIPDVVLKGNDLYLSFTRTQERNNRTR